jgi:RND family efflux transporter MFP subunit
MFTNEDGSAPWRTAFFALLGVIVVGYLVLRRDRRPIALVLSAAAIAVIVALAFAQWRYAPAPMVSSMAQTHGDAPVPVTLTVVRSNSADPTIAAPAYVAPYFTQNVVARAPGVLTNLSVYAGDHISAGAVIARLDEPELKSNAQAAQADVASERAALQSAGAQLRYWNAEIARERQLLDNGAVSVREYQDERAQAAAARSAYDGAQSKLAAAQFTAQSQSTVAGYTNIVPPADAVVMKRLVDPGVFVQAGTPILQVAVLDRLRVQAQVAQDDASSVHVGAPVDVRFGDGTVLRSRVSSVSPVADAATHTALAEAVIENAGRRLQPGGFAHVIIHLAAPVSSNAFFLPSAAVVGGTSTAVWIDASGLAHRVPVTVLTDDGMLAQVQSDELRSGARVVVRGAQSLEEGQPIVGMAP